MKERRLGKVTYSFAFLDECDMDELLTIFADFIPLRIDTCYMTLSTTMWGVSPHFEHVPEGNEPPEYEVILITHGTEDDCKVDAVKYRKVEGS